MFLLLETLVLEFYIRFGRKWINFCQPKGTLLVFKGNTSFFFCDDRGKETGATCILVLFLRHETTTMFFLALSN